MVSWLVLLLSVLASSAHPHHAKDPEKHTVVIVGAGISGFSAAAFLLENNVTEIVVLEASSRIGGRIHTLEMGNISLDMGAEFVLGKENNVVYDLVAPYDLLFSEPQQEAEGKLYTNTSAMVFDTVEFKNLTDLAYSVLKDSELANFNGSVGDFFFPRFEELVRAEGVDPALGEAVGRLVALEDSLLNGADDLYHLGTGDYLLNQKTLGEPHLKWKSGGYSTLFDIVSEKFPDPIQGQPVMDKIQLGKQVVRVEQLDGEVEVTCADGSTYSADHVIVTIPLGVLKQEAAEMFHPPLPPEKTAAIENLGFGCVGKVFIQFSSRWWPPEITTIKPLFSDEGLEEFKNSSSHGNWTSYTMEFSPVTGEERMLCARFVGDACRTMESLAEDEVADGLAELLERIVGDVPISQPEAVLRSRWTTEPFSLGSSSYWTVASGEEKHPNVDLAQPIFDKSGKPVVLFAGEATHPHQWGTVHGALASGVREAANIVNYIESSSNPPITPIAWSPLPSLRMMQH